MRFIISTFACKKNCQQRLELKTDSIFLASEIIRFFLIASNSCVVKVWKPKNKTKFPDVVFMPEFSQFENFIDSKFPIYLKNKMDFALKL